MIWEDRKLKKAVNDWEHKIKLVQASLGTYSDACDDLIKHSYKVAKLDNGESTYTKYALHAARTMEKLKGGLEELCKDIFTQATKELDEMGGENG